MKTNIREWHSRWCLPAMSILIIYPSFISTDDRLGLVMLITSPLAVIWMLIGYVIDANE